MDIDIVKIANSGQCFRMNPIKGREEVCTLVAFGEYLEIEKTDTGYQFSCSEEEWERLWKVYFDCSTDYEGLGYLIEEGDKYLQSALVHGKGIRILRQELFETIISFIISQQNNIPRIKKCVETLCTKYGEKRQNFRKEVYFTFPEPMSLAQAGTEALRDCGLGYRSRYIHETSRMIAEGEVKLSALQQMEYQSAKKELLKLPGVGIKVAECIALFGLHHVDAFPIDTHIDAVLKEYYPQGFPFKKYEGYAGILQQYMFYYDLKC